MPRTMSAHLCLPILKQGDDLARHLNDGKTAVASLKAYAADLLDAHNAVLQLAEVVQKFPHVSIQGDTHVITVEGPRKVLKPLADDGLLQEMEECEEGEAMEY